MDPLSQKARELRIRQLREEAARQRDLRRKRAHVERCKLDIEERRLQVPIPSSVSVNDAVVQSNDA